MTESSPEQLFLRYRGRGDVDALGELFDRTAPQLLGLARKLGDEGTAEDLLQETWLAALERPGRWDAARPLLPWLLGILAVEARRQRRRAARSADPRRLVERRPESPEQGVDQAELQRAIRDALTRIPPHHARVLRLRLLEGLGPTELAARLGIRPGTARVQLHRALSHLRTALPPGLAGSIAILGLGERGLAGVREVVLHRASTLSAKSAGLVGTVAGSILMKKLLLTVAASAALLGLFLGWRAFEPGTERPAAEPVAETHHADLPPSSPGEPPIDERRREVVASITHEASDGPPPAADELQDEAILRGRFLLPGGLPAAGVQVRLHAWEANDERTRRHGRPDDRSDVSVLSDAEGRFEIQFEPHGALQYSLNGRLGGHVDAQWRWGEWLPGIERDLGDIELLRAGRIAGTVVDREGQPLAYAWKIHSTTATAISGGNERTIRSCRTELDGADFVLEGMAPTRIELKLHSRVTGWQEPTFVEVHAGETTRVELTYRGPDPHGITQLDTWWHQNRWIDVEPEYVHVAAAGATITQDDREHVISGLELGDTCDVTIDDPSFLPWRGRLRGGEETTADLIGAGVLILEVLDEANGEPLEDYELSGGVRDRWSGDWFKAAGEAPPEGGRFKNLLATETVFRIGAPGYLPVERTVIFVAGRPVKLTVRLSRGNTIRGRVNRAGGAVAADVPLQLVRGELGENRVLGMHRRKSLQEARTDAEGKFLLRGHPDGPCCLFAGEHEFEQGGEQLELAGEPLEVVLQLPPTASLKGRLGLPAGVDLSTCCVVARREADRDPRLERHWSHESPRLVGAVDGQGRFELHPLGLEPYELALAVAPRELRWHSTFGADDDLVVLGIVEPEREGVFEQHFDLRDGCPGSLEVQLLLPEGISPGALKITARLEGEYLYASADPGLRHDVTLKPLRPARWHAVARHGTDGWIVSAAAPALVPPGGTARTEIVVDLIEGEVLFVDASGEPLPDFPIRWAHDVGPFGATCLRRSDSAGRVQLSLPAGEYRLQHEPDGDSGEEEWIGLDPPTILWPPPADQRIRARVLTPEEVAEIERQIYEEYGYPSDREDED